MNFREFLNKEKFIVLDGPMGTELIRRGIKFKTKLWSAEAIFDNWEIIQEIYIDYIKAGTDIITTNTFRTNPWTFQKLGYSLETLEKYINRAVWIARNSIEKNKSKRRVFIAGSTSPLEDCYSPDLSPDFETSYRYHKITTRLLKEASVDFILIETMNTINEALAASKAAKETGLPVATSFVLREDARILSGEDLIEGYHKLYDVGIDIFSINCTHYSVIEIILEKLLKIAKIPVCLYVNAGILKNGKWYDDKEFTPEKYRKIALKWYKMGVKIIGGCCFTTAKYIKSINRAKKLLLNN